MSKNVQIRNHFFTFLFPKDSEYLRRLDIGLQEVRSKKKLSKKNKWKKYHKKTFFRHGDLTLFLSKNVQIWDHFFPLLFLKDSEYLKGSGIELWEVVAKRPLNGVNKVWRTDKQTKIKIIINGKILCKKNAILENSKAYPSWQKMRDDNNFFCQLG